MSSFKFLRHTPILVPEILAMIPDNASRFFDGTLGHGGHAEHIVESRKSKVESKHIQYVGVDRDSTMITKAQGFLANFGDKILYVQGSYAELERITKETGVEQFDWMLLDIGVNMDHFKTAERGFSIKLDGPLDMRYDTSVGKSASNRLFSVKEKEFKATLEQYTDFRPGYIEKFLKAYYQNKTRYESTHQFTTRLKSFGMNDKVIAVLFQAIRIAVNEELDELQNFLQIFDKYLTVGGRCCILTFHSIEDRMVKLGFQALVQSGNFRLINKHVIAPTRKEKESNKASRSCKMRVIERLY